MQAESARKIVTVCQATDGTIVEVFEWAAGAAEHAPTNPLVLKLWDRYADDCDFVPLATLAESSTRFASFTPISLQAKSFCCLAPA